MLGNINLSKNKIYSHNNTSLIVTNSLINILSDTIRKLHMEIRILARKQTEIYKEKMIFNDSLKVLEDQYIITKRNMTTINYLQWNDIGDINKRYNLRTKCT